MSENQEDMNRGEKELTERINSVHHDAARMAERRRNEALGVFAFVAILLTILGYFGLQQIAQKERNIN